LTEGTRERVLELLKRHTGESGTLVRFGEEAAGLELPGFVPPEEGGLADVALVAGPMWKLRRVADRLLVLDEARRALKRGGVVAVLAAGRFNWLLDPSGPELAHTHLATDLEAELGRAGFHSPVIYGLEGPLWLGRRLEAEEMKRVEREPSLMGTSLHLLGIASKV
jgi:hypothetical protein